MDLRYGSGMVHGLESSQSWHGFLGDCKGGFCGKIWDKFLDDF